MQTNETTTKKWGTTTLAHSLTHSIIVIVFLRESAEQKEQCWWYHLRLGLGPSFSSVSTDERTDGRTDGCCCLTALAFAVCCLFVVENEPTTTSRLGFEGWKKKSSTQHDFQSVRKRRARQGGRATTTAVQCKMSSGGRLRQRDVTWRRSTSFFWLLDVT